MNSSRRPFVQSLLSAQSSQLLTDSTQSLIMTSEPSIELGTVEAPNNGHIWYIEWLSFFVGFFGIECMDTFRLSSVVERFVHVHDFTYML